MGPGNLVVKARPAMAGDDEATVSEAMITMRRALNSLQVYQIATSFAESR